MCLCEREYGQKTDGERDRYKHTQRAVGSGRGRVTHLRSSRVSPPVLSGWEEEGGEGKFGLPSSVSAAGAVVGVCRRSRPVERRMSCYCRRVFVGKEVMVLARGLGNAEQRHSSGTRRGKAIKHRQTKTHPPVLRTLGLNDRSVGTNRSVTARRKSAAVAFNKPPPRPCPCPTPPLLPLSFAAGACPCPCPSTHRVGVNGAL